jgi:hypothetical protein
LSLGQTVEEANAAYVISGHTFIKP